MSIYSSLESVARRYTYKAGCRFVSACEVAITVYVMDLRIIVIDSSDIDPIDEFLLRSLTLAIDTPSSLAEFLGLDDSTVTNRLVELRRQEYIDIPPSSDPSNIRFFLTAKGKVIADSLIKKELKEVTLQNVIYHGFLRKPILVTEKQLLRPHEVKAKGLRIIPPIPSRQPNPEEITLSEISEVINRNWIAERGKKPPELVNVRSILKNVRTMYQPSILLQYELLGELKQRQLSFVVDGLPKENYDLAFSEQRGAERIPDVLNEPYRSTAELAREYLRPRIADRLGTFQEADELVEKLDIAEQKVESNENRLREADRPDTRRLLREELERVQASKYAIEQSLASRKCRRLRTYDCRDILAKSLKDVRTRLLIVSAFLSDSVVNKNFLSSMEGALKRGVEIWVAYGMGKQGRHDRERTQHRDWLAAEQGLNDLRKRYKSLLHVLDQGNTHEKILLCDSDFVITGSFNWLSFSGESGRHYRYEDAILVREEEAIDEYYSEITSRFKPK